MEQKEKEAFFHLLAVCPQASFLTSLSLGFFI